MDDSPKIENAGSADEIVPALEDVPNFVPTPSITSAPLKGETSSDGDVPLSDLAYKKEIIMARKTITPITSKGVTFVLKDTG